MLREFIDFLRKTNALALAIAVIIGAAIAKVVASVVLVLGGGDWRTLQIPLKTAPDGKVLSAIGIGNFLGALVDFIIIAFFVFIVTKALLRETPPAPGPSMKTWGACGESILAQAARCKYCTSAV